MNTHNPSRQGRFAATRKASVSIAVAAALLVVTGCATNALDRAPVSASQPWRPLSAPPELGNEAQADNTALQEGFSVPRDPRMADLPAGPAIDEKVVYSLPQLIDIAQRENPSTQLAWNRARQAALAVGVAEATFLPMLSANVIGGWQRTRTPLPLSILGYDPEVDTNLKGVAPFLAVEWLLFDFGQRAALLEAAEHGSYAANVLFNAAHQRIILEVTQAYYAHAAAQARLRVAEQALANSRQVQTAVEQRLKHGVATTVELALARQQVAQAVLREVHARGAQQNTYQALLAAVGLSPNARIQVAGLPDHNLPLVAGELTDEAVRMALSQRPDLQASYAAMKAAQAGVVAAEAEFLPKVYLAAVAGANRTNFEVGNLPGLRQRTSASAVLIGVNMPLYDGGLRAARLKDAEVHVDNAKRLFEKTQQDAVREIILAQDILNTALASYYAAEELVSTASTAYDAALEAYQNGVGTITMVTEASTGLLDARSARADAHAASLTAAANLAFVMGPMTSRRDSWLE